MSDIAGLAAYVKRFGSLRVAREGPRPRPHKPAMLLAVLSLAENGRLVENMIHPDPELVELFKRYFEATRAGSDRCTPENPFFYLKNEGFWHLHTRGSQAPVGGMTAPGSWATIVDQVEHASLVEDLFTLMATPVARETLRDALIATYFPSQREVILGIAAQDQVVGAVRRKWAEGTSFGDVERSIARDSGFARTVRQAYDYRCPARGIRFIYEDTTLIDAAHLMPWSISRDDRPQNGMALCKNHHWVMDKDMFAPGPDQKWHVSRSLDDRIEGQVDLLKYDGREILLPVDEKLKPDPAALEWRVGQLR